MNNYTTYFWHAGGENGYLSQWYEVPFYVRGTKFPTAEHAMMYEKARLFDDNITKNKIKQAETPREAKKLGREIQGFNQHIWDANKKEIVVRNNVAKFTQNPKLLELLLSLPGYIIEASPLDMIWGSGWDKKKHQEIDKQTDSVISYPGQNLLGVCLMIVRDKIKEGNL